MRAVSDLHSCQTKRWGTVNIFEILGDLPTIVNCDTLKRALRRTTPQNKQQTKKQKIKSTMYRSILATLFFAVNVAAQGKPDDPTNYTPKRVRDLREEDDKHLAELRAPGSGWVEIEDGILMKVRLFLFYISLVLVLASPIVIQ